MAEAKTGEDALARAELGMPDLILLDWHMPGLPPRETTEHNMEDIAEAKKSGADDYLLKPFDRVTFEGKINELALHA